LFKLDLLCTMLCSVSLPLSATLLRSVLFLKVLYGEGDGSLSLVQVMKSLNTDN
jgi:hypothetical protein